MRYRTLQIGDHKCLLELWQSCDGVSLRDADSKQGIAKYLTRNPGFSFVAEEQGRIQGSLMAGHDGKRGYIQHLAVASDRRNQGIAGHLLELCLAALLAEGIVKSHVHVASNNKLGRDFWSRRGWIERADIELYSFINGENENT